LGGVHCGHKDTPAGLGIHLNVNGKKKKNSRSDLSGIKKNRSPTGQGGNTIPRQQRLEIRLPRKQRFGKKRMGRFEGGENWGKNSNGVGEGVTIPTNSKGK